MAFIGDDFHTNSFTICHLETDGCQHYKTDKNDARVLAFFLSKDMLPETRARSVANGGLASLTHTRDLLVKKRTRLLNKIHALFNRHGIKVKKESLGSKLVRMTLVECSLIAIRYSGYLNTFYRRIEERGGSGKAIITTARKLLAIVKIAETRTPAGQSS